MKIKIGVTELEYSKSRHIFINEQRFECIPVPADESQLASEIFRQKIKHIIVGASKYEGSLYELLSAGSVIARYGVGHDGINKEMATKRGIFCTYTPGALDNSVAEYTISLMLIAARQIIMLSNGCANGKWQSFVGFELKNKKLAVIGCGPIGRRVSQIASSGFQMEVTGCELQDVDTDLMKKEYGFSVITKDYDEAVENADFVSLHIPNNSATYHFINERRIGLIPEKGWLINTARGAVVDENALYDAIENKKIAGAVLDVFENEPYIPRDNKDLRDLKNIIMFPHIGSSTREACNKMAILALQNIHYAESGNYDKMDLLNKELLTGFRSH